MKSPRFCITLIANEISQIFSPKFIPFDHIVSSYEIAEALNRGVRPHRPESMPSDFYDYIRLQAWWHQSASQRPGMQEVLEYFECYNTPYYLPPPVPRFTPSSAVLPWRGTDYLLHILASLIPGDRDRLLGLSQETDPYRPVYILVDEYVFTFTG